MIAAALLAFAAAAHRSVASGQWALDALAGAGIGLVDVAAAADAVAAAATPRWQRAVTECLPMASFRSNFTEYRIVEVADLPSWHNPKSDCHRDLWLARARQVDAGRGVLGAFRRRRVGAASKGTLPSWDAGLAAGRWLSVQLAGGTLAPCGRHDLTASQVRSAAARAIRVWQTTRPWSRQSALEALAPTRQNPLDPESRFAWSLLAEPISWVEGADDVGNGTASAVRPASCRGP